MTNNCQFININQYKQEIKEAYGHCAKCSNDDIWLFSYKRKKPYTEREMYGFHMNGYKKTPYVAALCEQHMKQALIERKNENRNELLLNLYRKLTLHPDSPKAPKWKKLIQRMEINRQSSLAY